MNTDIVTQQKVADVMHLNREYTIGVIACRVYNCQESDLTKLQLSKVRQKITGLRKCQVVKIMRVVSNKRYYVKQRNIS